MPFTIIRTSARIAMAAAASCLVLVACGQSKQPTGQDSRSVEGHLPIRDIAGAPRENGSVWIELGTMAGPIPSATRAQPAHLLIHENEKILVDVADGTPQQLAKAGVQLREVDSLFISHLHFDHMAGIYAFLGLRYQVSLPFTKGVTVYGPPGTKELVKSVRESMKNAVPLVSFPIPDFRVVEMTDGSSVKVGKVQVTAASNTHYATMSDADKKERLSLSYRFDMPGKSIVFTGDTGPSPAVERLSQDVDILVSEIMDLDGALKIQEEQYGKLPQAITDWVVSHHTKEHLFANEVGLLAARAGARSLVLTHFAGDLGDPAQIERLTAEIAQHYKGPITFANDLDRFGVTPALTQ